MQRITFRYLTAIELLFALSFFVSCWLSDRALDKSGIGDPERFTFWNNIAGILFYIFILTWIISIVILLIVRHKLRTKTNTENPWQPTTNHIWLPPLLLFVGWIVCVL
ncbi:MAG TPA: hypothetical protein DCX54_08795 [Flavobacteriales bacterium]|nr:hypothetical protein [Flavobacteriales bacterium]